MTEEQTSSDNKSDETEKPSVPPNAHKNLYLAIGALTMAAIGQYYLAAIQGKFTQAIIFFSFSGLIFLILSWRVENQHLQNTKLLKKFDDVISWVYQRVTASRVLVILSLGIAYTVSVALGQRPGNISFWDIFILWAIGILLYSAAFIEIKRINIGGWIKDNRLDILFVIGLTLAGGVLRFIWLGSVPEIISGDEGQIGNLMRSVIANWKSMNMFGTTFGHGNLYLFIMAGFAQLIGKVDIFSLRFTSALVGTLTIPATYIFARRFFNMRTAVIAAALLATSHIHIHFSRVIVAGSIQDAFFTILVWYFFLGGLERRSNIQMAISGLLLGIFMHIYMGARLTVLLVPVYILALWITNPKVVRENLTNLMVFAGAFFVSVLPIAQWAYANPNEFNARMNQIGIIQSGWLAQEAIRTGQSQLHIFMLQLRDAFLSVIYYPANGFYFSNHAMIDSITAVFFMMGLIFTLLHIKDKRYLLLHGWLWSAILVGGALVVIPANGAYRILMILPAVCIFSAIGFDRFLAFAIIAFKTPRAQILATVVLLLVIGILNLRFYWGEFAFTCKYDDANAHIASYMGESLGNLGNSYHAFFMGAPRYRYGIHPSTDFLSNNNIITNVDTPITAPPVDLNSQAPVVFYFVPERANELTFVQKLFPNGQEERINDCGEPLLVIYHVP